MVAPSLVVGIDLLVEGELAELVQEQLLLLWRQLVQQLLRMGQILAGRSWQRLQARRGSLGRQLSRWQWLLRLSSWQWLLLLESGLLLLLRLLCSKAVLLWNGGQRLETLEGIWLLLRLELWLLLLDCWCLLLKLLLELLRLLRKLLRLLLELLRLLLELLRLLLELLRLLLKTGRLLKLLLL